MRWSHFLKPIINKTVGTILVFGVVSTYGNAALGRDFADLIVHNAKVTTQDPDLPYATAIAIRDGRIIAVDDAAGVLGHRGPDTIYIDAHQRRLIPGLIDSHSHFLRSGLTYTRELRWDGVPSLKIALEMVREQAARTPPGEWVRVIGGWTPWQFEAKRLPTPDELNEVAPRTPVYVQYFYSAGIVNRTGMESLGIGKHTEDPKGGRFERDPLGNPTGLMLAEPHPGIFYGKIAALPRATPEVEVNSTMHLFYELARWGLTGVIDAGGGGFKFPNAYSTAEKLAAAGKLPLRATFYLFAQRPGKEVEDFTNWSGTYMSGWNLDENKAHGYELDGGGEYLLWESADFENFRWDRPTPPSSMEQNLARVLAVLVKKRWAFKIHATYDETIVRILDVSESVNQETPLNGLRWSIEHGETIKIDSIRRVKELGGGVAIQNRMVFLGDDFVGRYGEDAAQFAPPLRELVESGVPVGMGTDATRGSTFNPWVSLHFLVTGKTASGRQLYPKNNLLTRAEALHVHTLGSAWFSNEEREKGRISRGQMADFALLSKDYFSVPESEIPAIQSVLTVVGGKVVYGTGDYEGLSPELPPILPHWSPINYYGSYYTPQ